MPIHLDPFTSGEMQIVIYYCTEAKKLFVTVLSISTEWRSDNRREKRKDKFKSNKEEEKK